MGALVDYFNGFGWAGQYYFLILIQAAFLIPLVAGRRIGWGWVIGAFLVLLAWTVALSLRPRLAHPLSGHVGLDDRWIIMWLPYLLLGSWLSQRWAGRLPSVVPGVVGWATLAAATLLLAVAPRAPNPPELAHMFNRYQDPLLVAMLPAIFLAACAAANAMPAVIARPLATAGEYSLGVYCMNPLLDGLAVRRLLAGVHVGPTMALPASVVAPLVETALIVGATTLFSVVLDRCGLSRLVR